MCHAYQRILISSVHAKDGPEVTDINTFLPNLDYFNKGRQHFFFSFRFFLFSKRHESNSEDGEQISEGVVHVLIRSVSQKTRASVSPYRQQPTLSDPV